jgi:hypothetical protein
MGAAASAAWPVAGRGLRVRLDDYQGAPPATKRPPVEELREVDMATPESDRDGQ